jgi:hypothetical protein
MVLLSVPVFEVNGSESDSILEVRASCLVAVIFLPVAEFFETLNAAVGGILVEFVEIKEIGDEGLNLEIIARSAWELLFELSESVVM